MNKVKKVSIRFSLDEYAIIEKQLDEHGISFSDFSRSVLLKKKLKYPIKIEQLYHLNMISLNIESLAKEIIKRETSYTKAIISQLCQIENILKELF